MAAAAEAAPAGIALQVGGRASAESPATRQPHRLARLLLRAAGRSPPPVPSYAASHRRKESPGWLEGEGARKGRGHAGRARGGGHGPNSSHEAACVECSSARAPHAPFPLDAPPQHAPPFARSPALHLSGIWAGGITSSELAGLPAGFAFSLGGAGKGGVGRRGTAMGKISSAARAGSGCGGGSMRFPLSRSSAGRKEGRGDAREASGLPKRR